MSIAWQLTGHDGEH